MNWIDLATAIVVMYAIAFIVALYVFFRIFKTVIRSFEKPLLDDKPKMLDLNSFKNPLNK